MRCKKCQYELMEGWVACPACGTKCAGKKPRKKRRRANGEGTIIKRGGTYSLRITVGWKPTENGFTPVFAEKGGFKTQREAMEHVQTLREANREKAKEAAGPRHGVNYSSITFDELYQKLIAREEKRITRDTLNCYKAAYKYYADLTLLPFADLNTEDWQLCVDDCPKGTRTKENMKALGTKMYKMAAELRVFGLSTTTDFARLVWIDKDDKESRQPFTMEEVQKIKDAVSSQIPYADYILAMCYTGFRPSEFLALEHDAYDPIKNTLCGGAKTEAGKKRIIPVHPIISDFIKTRYLAGDAYLFPDRSGHPMTLNTFRSKFFYPALEMAGIQKTPEESGGERPSRTPYSCRHTFATMMKDVSGSPRDKAALMGHTSYEMTLHYQHEDYDSLKEIVEQIR